MARITMPQLGETVTEGTVTRWLKSPGDHVGLDEPLLEVSTDKVDTEIPSAFEGVLARIVVAEGDTVPIGALLAEIGDESASSDYDLTPAAAVPTPTADRDDRAEEGLAPGAVDRAGGPDGDGTGRETAAERHQPTRTFRRSMEGGAGYLQPAVEVPRPVAPAPVAHAAPAPPSGPAAVERRVMGSAAPIDERDIARRIPYSTIRRRTAEHLTASLHTAAHTLVSVEVDYAAVDGARERHGAAWRRRTGASLTYLPFIARAACDALAAYPLLNASMGEDELLVHRRVHLGIAVDLDHEGLIVPVVRDADALRLPELAERLRDRAARAHQRTLTGDEITGGTFTITNAGGLGTFLTVPVINPPQVAILSTDGVRMRPVAVPLPDGGYGVAVHPVGNLALSFDHRAVDGAYAAEFVDQVRRHLQERAWDVELIVAGFDRVDEEAGR